jgi:hypothetical protein
MSEKVVVPFVPKTQFALKVGWPTIYPEQADKPLIFHVRVQLVKEAEEVQREFLGLATSEQESESDAHDIAMLSLICTAPPEGFSDFPEVNGGKLSDVIREYFTRGDEERQAGMGFIARGVMQRYWRRIVPAEYL